MAATEQRLRPLRIGAPVGDRGRALAVPPVPDPVPDGPVASDGGRPAEGLQPTGARADLPESHFDRVAPVALALWAACVNRDQSEFDRALDHLQGRFEIEGLI